MSSIILEFDRNPQISEIDRLQSFMESVQRAFNEIEVSYDDLELEKHPLIGTISKDNQDFKVLFKDYAQFKVVTANAVEAIKGTFESLDTKYAKIDMANIGTAWVEDLLVKGSFIAKEVDAGTGQFTKYLAGVRIHGDLIEANTLRANTLIIRGDDGIYRRLNIDSLGQATVDSDPKYNQGLDGSIIVAESITATKIAGHTITAEQIASNTITTTELKASEIFANEANINILTATDVFANAISTNKVLVGAKTSLETLDKFVATWKHSSDATLIDGGKIYTGSITADKIDVNSIFAKEINATGKITGAKLYSAYIETGSGKVGGFSIGSTYIALGTTGFKATDNSIYIGTDGISLGKTFGVTKAGALTATGVDISGKITADSGSFTGTITANDGGNIGGFTIKKGSYIAYNTSSLAGAANSVYIGTNGISLGTKFKVDTNGKVTATDGVFNGEITANKLTITEGATISGLRFDKLVGSTEVTTSITNAANAASAAANAASAAANTAKHFLEWDGTNGLQVGNKQNGSWVGTRTKMGPSAFEIIDASNNVVASYGAKVINLGIAASDAYIYLCNKAGYIMAESDGSAWSVLKMVSKTLRLHSEGNVIGSVRLMAKSTSNYVAQLDLISGNSDTTTYATLALAGKSYQFGATEATGFVTPFGISTKKIHLSDSAITGGATRPTYNGGALALKSDVADIRCGSYGMGTSIAAGSYRDITHTFSPAFASEPNVVATLFSDGTAAALGNVEVAIVSKSTTEVKFRIFNNSGAARSPGLTWMATCK